MDEFAELTEEQKISAQFGAMILGGQLGDGPPDPQSPLGRWLAMGGGREALTTIWKELGYI